MCIVIDMCDETNSLPVYGSLKYLCVYPDMQPLAICMLFETVGFNDRFQAYCVKKTSTMISIQFNEIPCIRPTFVCIKNNSCFIPKSCPIYFTFLLFKMYNIICIVDFSYV